MTTTKQQFDLSILAKNGLRRGRTTGACATAAVKAAVLLLEHQQHVNEVMISLPDQQYFLSVPIANVQLHLDGAAFAEVIKDAGDDPDRTHGATITARVKRNHTGSIRFLADNGVGIVTQLGIRVAIGEPAINPIPREMMTWAIDDVLEGSTNPGYDIFIGCPNGEEIAKKTFNPRLGIVGGISILGTSGIVEPMSLDAYKASIEVYIRVALAENTDSAAFMPGNIGITFANRELHLVKKRIVQIANFLGFSLDCAQQTLSESNTTIDTLWVLGHPGKLAKILDNVWDTHSSKSKLATHAISQVAKDLGFDLDKVNLIAQCNTVEAIMNTLGYNPDTKILWTEVEQRASRLIQPRCSRASHIQVRLFDMSGKALGEAA